MDGDICASRAGLVWRHKDRKYYIHDNREVYHEIKGDHSVSALSIGHHQNVMSICTSNDCNLLITDPEDTASWLDNAEVTDVAIPIEHPHDS